MQVQVDIEFEQLVRIVKDLPAAKLKKLQALIKKEVVAGRPRMDLESLLLNGPVATKKQLETIANNRKAINQWRAKL